MFIYDIWNFSHPLDKIGLTIRGHSRSSEGSCFFIPELKIFFDAGMRSPFNPNYVFITHCHSDHSQILPQILTGITTTPTVYVPQESRQFCKDYLIAAIGFFINCPSSCVIENYPVKGVTCGEVVKVEYGKGNYNMKVYDLDHSIPTRGYGLCEVRKKLKEEYVGIEGKEIGRLRKEGVEITEDKMYWLLAYICDTSISVLSKYPELFNYPYLIIECTFLYDEEYEMAEAKKHIHWKDLKPFVVANSQCEFILIHFSMRYKEDEIKGFFEKEKLDNVFAWTN
jgi:ribonuclease Z